MILRNDCFCEEEWALDVEVVMSIEELLVSLCDRFKLHESRIVDEKKSQSTLYTKSAWRDLM